MYSRNDYQKRECIQEICDESHPGKTNEQLAVMASNKYDGSDTSITVAYFRAEKSCIKAVFQAHAED